MWSRGIAETSALFVKTSEQESSSHQICLIQKRFLGLQPIHCLPGSCHEGFSVSTVKEDLAIAKLPSDALQVQVNNFRHHP